MGHPQRLPSGRHDLSREDVVRSQRERIVAGMLGAVAEQGYPDTSVADVIGRAGVSRATFYELFASKEECFIVMHGEVISALVGFVRSAFEEAEEWPDQVREGLAALLRFVAGNPDAARVVMVEVMAAGPRALGRYRAGTRAFITYVDRGREFADAGEELPESLAATIVGSIAEAIFTEVLAGRAAAAPRLLPDLVYLTLLPYLGHDAALAEMQRTPRPAAQAGGVAEEESGDPKAERAAE